LSKFPLRPSPSPLNHQPHLHDYWLNEQIWGSIQWHIDNRATSAAHHPLTEFFFSQETISQNHEQS